MGRPVPEPAPAEGFGAVTCLLRLRPQGWGGREAPKLPNLEEEGKREQNPGRGAPLFPPGSWLRTCPAPFSQTWRRPRGTNTAPRTGPVPAGPKTGDLWPLAMGFGSWSGFRPSSAWHWKCLGLHRQDGVRGLLPDTEFTLRQQDKDTTQPVFKHCQHHTVVSRQKKRRNRNIFPHSHVAFSPFFPSPGKHEPPQPTPRLARGICSPCHISGGWKKTSIPRPSDARDDARALGLAPVPWEQDLAKKQLLSCQSSALGCPQGNFPPWFCAGAGGTVLSQAPEAPAGTEPLVFGVSVPRLCCPPGITPSIFTA